MTGRPDSITPLFGELYDWFANNGIDEIVPSDPSLVVRADTLTYLSWVWRDGKRGWDLWNVVLGYGGFPRSERRTMPLLAPPTERIRALARAARIHLTEIVPASTVKAGAVP